MSAPREAQSSMPGLAEPQESGRSMFGPSLTPPPRPINVAAALFMPIPADVAPPCDGNDVNLYGGNLNQAQTMAFHQHHYYPDNTSAHARASGFQDSTHVLKGWTNRSLWTSPQSISSKRTAKTGRVFLSRAQFKNWRRVVNSIFWVSGKPGAGKTYLASAAFEEINDKLKSNPNEACTVIYLKHNDQWTTWDIVSFIIIDLVESKPLPAALEAIRETLRKQRTMGERPSLSDLMALLHKVVKLYGRCYILIDGLDEMKVDIQVEMIGIIAELGANVFLTSRPLNLVQDQLAKVALNKPVFTTVAAENEDLKLYIEDIINRTPTFASLLDDSYPKEQLITKIQTNADGMFLHAMLQMEVLRHCIDQEELLQLLDQFPLGLEEMYADAVRRIERQPLSHVLRAKTALVWLVHANGSMSIDDLRCATATVAPEYRVEPKRMLTEDNLLTICCGLVTVDTKTGQARLIHDTARDALRSLLSEHCPKAQAMMARACITRLVEFEFHQSSVTDASELQDIYTKAPLLRYAYLAVQHHVRKGVEEDPSLVVHVEQFVRKCSSFPYPDPWSTTIHGFAALHVAILFNQQPIVENLLHSGGGDVNEKTNHELGGISPLAIAALEGFDSLTRYLLTVPDVHVNDGELTPLMCAAIRGRDIIVKQLLSHFEGLANGEGRQGQAWAGTEVNRAGRFGRAAPGFAAFGGHTAVVKLFLGVEGVDINKGEDNGWTPILNACQENHIEVVNLLLNSHGIDLNRTTNHGTSPLFVASQNGHVDVVKLLLGAPGIDINQVKKDGASALFVASQNGHVEVVKLLLSAHGIDVNHAMNDNASPLFISSENGHVEVVKLLLSVSGIDTNRARNDGASPLFMASQNGHVEVVKLLVSAPGIDVNLPWQTGASPLFQASRNGHVEVVKLLLSAPGINVNQAMNDGASPLFMASQNGHVEVVKLLLSAHSIYPNQRNIQQVSPLTIASYCGHKEVVQVLLDVPGIDITHLDSHLNTALTYASRKGHSEIVQMLLDGLGRGKEPLDLLRSSPVSSDGIQAGSPSAMAAPRAVWQPFTPPPVDPVGVSPSLSSQTRHLSLSPPHPVEATTSIRTSSLSPPALDWSLLEPTMRKRWRSPPPVPPSSDALQGETAPKRPRIRGLKFRIPRTTHDDGLDSGSTSEEDVILPPAPAPPLHQGSTFHPATTASPLLDPPQDEARTPKRKGSPPGSASDLDASQDERARKRRRLT